MRPFAIAGVQMKVSAVASNVEMMKLKIDITMNLYPWIEMVLFSELCAYGPLTHTAQEIPCSFETEMQAMAKKYGIWLLPGSIFEKSNGKIYNTATVINPKGEIVTRYRKMFPFYPYEVGVTPSLGAEVILHPTMSGTIDRDIELSIVRAMASVNQCYFFDVNGLDTGGTGRSIVCGPDGLVIHQSEGTEEIIPLELNIARVKRSRELGILRLGQPLKSFRDHLGQFKIYQPDAPHPYLDSLGPLIKPNRLDKLTELIIKEDNLEHPRSSVHYKGDNSN
ncbi:carbon-nitrogen hydrolase family protein [uncultured Eudoraea sp.]|uniref:carbon-nitrogen hydrolase family protein n=1 Tax=uncultured Eudoraea sp. TaxID=1035614 RepID=UPI0026339461|nr:carbon-nitrogen hydrolase family protein [uncultured Eudoraea sp.]